MKLLIIIFTFIPFISFTQETNLNLTQYQIDTIWLNNLKKEKSKSVQIEEIKKRILRDTLYFINNPKPLKILVTDSLIYYYACDTIIEKRQYVGSDVISLSDTVKRNCGDRLSVLLKYKRKIYLLDSRIDNIPNILEKINENNIEKIDFLNCDETVIEYKSLSSIYGTIILHTNDKSLKKIMYK